MPAGSGNCGPAPLFLTWHCQTIDAYNPWPPARQADHASIAVNSAGLATVACYGFITADSGNLAVAQQLLQTFQPLLLKN